MTMYAGWRSGRRGIKNGRIELRRARYNDAPCKSTQREAFVSPESPRSIGSALGGENCQIGKFSGRRSQFKASPFAFLSRDGRQEKWGGRNWEKGDGLVSKSISVQSLWCVVVTRVVMPMCGRVSNLRRIGSLTSVE